MALPSIAGPSGGVAGANFVRVSVNQPVRWRDDGTDPTTTAGMPVAASASFDYDGKLSALKIIATTASSATVDVSYYRASHQSG